MRPEGERGSKRDPVIPDQAGRLMPVDPFGTNQPREQAVRLRAYELYEQRGRQDGRAMDDWFQAESQVQ